MFECTGALTYAFACSLICVLSAAFIVSLSMFAHLHVTINGVQDFYNQTITGADSLLVRVESTKVSWSCCTCGVICNIQSTLRFLGDWSQGVMISHASSLLRHVLDATAESTNCMSEQLWVHPSVYNFRLFACFWLKKHNNLLTSHRKHQDEVTKNDAVDDRKLLS